MGTYKDIKKFDLLKRYWINLQTAAAEDDDSNISDMVQQDEEAILVDLGCGPRIHFQQTLVKIVKKIKPKKVVACDIVKEFVEEAKEEGFEGRVFNFENKFPFKDRSVKIVFANQIIEHLYDIDNFLSEVYRILDLNGYLLIGTENLASWYNIFSLILGFQPFILTNISNMGPIGNPFSLHKNACLLNVEFSKESEKFLQHTKVLAYQGFVELLSCYGFKVEEIKGAGYYPLPPFLARFLAKIDLRHANRLQIKARKVL